MKRDHRTIITITLLAALTLPQLARAQTYEIPASVVGNGGGTATSASYSLSGTVGQPAAEVGLTGGTYNHDGGFWPAAQVLTTPVGLAGIYAIGTGEVYPTFSDAVTALAAGVSGPVTFQVKQGTYDEQLTIGPITGASATNTVTFGPHPDNTLPVVLSYSAATATDNWVVKLDGAQRVTIKGLRFEATNSEYSRLIQLEGDADHINLIDNDFVGLTPTTASPASALVFGESYPPSTFFTADSLIIKGNNFENGSYGVYLYGYYDPMPTDAEISGNTFTEQMGHSVRLDQLDGPVINENTISSVTGTDMIGIYLHSCVNDVEVSGNLIDLAQGGKGIYGSNNTGTATQKILIANNRIHVGGGTSTLAFAINLWSGVNDYIQILHNTVHVSCIDVGGRNSAGLYIGNSGDLLTNLAVHNNIFTSTGGGYTIYNDVAPTTGYTANHNDLYTTGTYLLQWGGYWYDDLASFHSVHPDLETNSISANPLFVDAAAGDYHLRGDSPAIGKGDGTIIAPPIGFDIEGNPRPLPAASNPDLGAYEHSLGTPETFVVSVADSLALVALYNSTDGSNWYNAWDLDTPVADWYGVTVADGRVTGLDLFNNNLSGPIPTEIGDLTGLTYLSLTDNPLTGSIPDWVGTLTQLTRFYLWDHQLSGGIPDWVGPVS